MFNKSLKILYTFYKNPMKIRILAISIESRVVKKYYLQYQGQVQQKMLSSYCAHSTLKRNNIKIQGEGIVAKYEA